MVDRGNIVVREGKSNVVFYTHWRGSEIINVVRESLRKKERWTDAPYLARIIFDVLTEGEHGSTSGFGISTGLGDNEHNIIVVIPEDQVVEEYSEESFLEYGPPLNRFSFQSFIDGASMSEEAGEKSDDPLED